MDNTHIVTFHNFKNPISVSLQFKNVFVGLEGEVALFEAIIFGFPLVITVQSLVLPPRSKPIASLIFLMN